MTDRPMTHDDARSLRGLSIAMLIVFITGLVAVTFYTRSSSQDSADSKRSADAAVAAANSVKEIVVEFRDQTRRSEVESAKTECVRVFNANLLNERQFAEDSALFARLANDVILKARDQGDARLEADAILVYDHLAARVFEGARRYRDANTRYQAVVDSSKSDPTEFARLCKAGPGGS